MSGVRLRTPRVELRWPGLQDLDELATRASEGVHSPDVMPFFSQWTDGDPETVARRVMQRHWAALGAWSPDDWTLYLVVAHDGAVVGSQSLGARNFAMTREVLLTGWLARSFQRQGLGTHARAAMLHLAFAGLDAQCALSVVQQTNAASQGVCRKLGFVKDGTQTNAVRGKRVVSDRYRLHRQTWAANQSIPVEMSNLEPGLKQFFSAPASDDRHGTGTNPLPSLPPLAQNLSGIQFVAEGDHDDD